MRNNSVKFGPVVQEEMEMLFKEKVCAQTTDEDKSQ